MKKMGVEKGFPRRGMYLCAPINLCSSHMEIMKFMFYFVLKVSNYDRFQYNVQGWMLDNKFKKLKLVLNNWKTSVMSNFGPSALVH